MSGARRAYRRTVTALLAMMIIAMSMILGMSLLRHIPAAGDQPRPSGNAQAVPVPRR